MRNLLFTIVLLIVGWGLIGCYNEGSQPEVLRDGEWVGSGDGRGGTIIAKVYIANHAVQQVVIVSQSESVFAQEAINTIVAKAIGRTGTMAVEVDGVTGATLTSVGVIDAINMAINASLGKDTGKKKYSDASCDIVVIGAGGAGLSAAVAAAQSGELRIIVLEKQGIIGGNTNYSTGGINAAETEVQQRLGIEDSKSLFYDDIMRGGHEKNIPELVQNFVEHAPTTISWLIGLGADLSDVGLMGGSSVKRTHRPEGGKAIGPHLMQVLRQSTDIKNIEIRTSNKVIGLISKDDAVTGVEVENYDGSVYWLQAKAVVIATGGFGANLEMVTTLQPSLQGFATLCHPGATGDAFEWTAAIGGATIQMEYIQIHPTAEAKNHILISEAVRGNGAILINHDAERFCNELDTRDSVSAAILRQRGGEAFLLFDHAVRESLAAIETYVNQHLLIEGQDLDELAQKAELPADQLKETVAAAQTLNTPPYYTVLVTPAIHHTMGGLSVDTLTRVLHQDGTPIGGLFAAGEVTGGLHGANRLGGNGVADIVVNGRLAGLQAAKHCTQD